MTGPGDLPDERLLRRVMADARDLTAREGRQPTIGSRMAMLLGGTLELAAAGQRRINQTRTWL